MSKSAKDDPAWGKPPGWGSPPEGEASESSVAGLSTAALVAGVVACVSALLAVVSILTLAIAIATGIVAMSLGQRARAQGRQLGATPVRATVGLVLGAAAALLAPLFALGPIFLSAL